MRYTDIIKWAKIEKINSVEKIWDALKKQKQQSFKINKKIDKTDLFHKLMEDAFKKGK